MTLGERISQKRKAAGLSQEALGNILGVSRQAIYKWETDQSVPELEKLIQMSQVFEISLGWLVNEEEGSRTDDSQTAEEIKQSIMDVKDNTAHEIRKGNKGLLLVLAGVMLAGFVTTGIRFHRMERKYEELQNTLDNYNYYTQNQINNIVSSVQSALNQYSDQTVNKSITVKGIDLASNTIRFELNCQPKKYTEDMQAVFHITTGEQTVDLPGELYADEGYHAEADIEITDYIAVNVEFMNGDESLTEKIAEYNNLYSDSFGEFDITFPIPFSIQETSDGTVLEKECDLAWYSAASLFILDGNVSLEPIAIDDIAIELYEDSRKVCDYTYLIDRTEVLNDGLTILHFERPEHIKVDLTSHIYEEHLTVTDSYGRIFRSSFICDDSGTE